MLRIRTNTQITIDLLSIDSLLVVTEPQIKVFAHAEDAQKILLYFDNVKNKAVRIKEEVFDLSTWKKYYLWMGNDQVFPLLSFNYTKLPSSIKAIEISAVNKSFAYISIYSDDMKKANSDINSALKISARCVPFKIRPIKIDTNTISIIPTGNPGMNSSNTFLYNDYKESDGALIIASGEPHGDAVKIPEGSKVLFHGITEKVFDNTLHWITRLWKGPVWVLTTDNTSPWVDNGILLNFDKPNISHKFNPLMRFYNENINSYINRVISYLDIAKVFMRQKAYDDVSTITLGAILKIFTINNRELNYETLYYQVFNLQFLNPYLKSINIEQYANYLTPQEMQSIVSSSWLRDTVKYNLASQRLYYLLSSPGFTITELEAGVNFVTHNDLQKSKWLTLNCPSYSFSDTANVFFEVLLNSLSDYCKITPSPLMVIKNIGTRSNILDVLLNVNVTAIIYHPGVIEQLVLKSVHDTAFNRVFNVVGNNSSVSLCEKLDLDGEIVASQNAQQCVLIDASKRKKSILLNPPKVAINKEHWMLPSSSCLSSTIQIAGGLKESLTFIKRLVAFNLKENERPIFIIGGASIALNQNWDIEIPQKDAFMLNPLDNIFSPKQKIWWGAGLGFTNTYMTALVSAGITSLQEAYVWSKTNRYIDEAHRLEEILKTEKFSENQVDINQLKNLGKKSIGIESVNPAFTRALLLLMYYVEPKPLLVLWNCGTHITYLDNKVLDYFDTLHYSFYNESNIETNKQLIVWDDESPKIIIYNNKLELKEGQAVLYDKRARKIVQFIYLPDGDEYEYSN